MSDEPNPISGADLGVKCPACGAAFRIPLQDAFEIGMIGGHGDPGGYGWFKCAVCGVRCFVGVDKRTRPWRVTIKRDDA